MDGGFVAGTLVHTNKGLVPIEKIKVGDMVLSRHESGEGELAYKRVANVFSAENATILQISYEQKNKPIADFQMKVLYLATEQLFWVVKDTDDNILNKWVTQEPYTGGDEVPYLNGELYQIQYVAEVLRTDNPKVGFAYDIMNDKPELVVELNNSQISTYFIEHLFRTNLDYRYKDHKHIPDNGYSKETILGNYNFEVVKKFFECFEVQGKPDVFQATVYTLDVDDFHTYFVDEGGIWVHDKTASRSEVK